MIRYVDNGFSMPEISVVIPALNEAKYIRYPRQGLGRQSFKDSEIIVVDGESEDRTAALARGFAKVIVTKRRGASAARNAGACHSKGKVILFIDADTIPSPKLLESYHDIFLDKSVAAATGPIYPIERGRILRAAYILVSKHFVKLSIILGMPCIVGSNFAVRASCLRRSGGFNERLITYEDWDFSNRLKRYGKIRYADSASVSTSARRVIAWGILGYFFYYLVNMAMYSIFKKSMSNYRRIR